MIDTSSLAGIQAASAGPVAVNNTAPLPKRSVNTSSIDGIWQASGFDPATKPTFTQTETIAQSPSTTEILAAQPNLWASPFVNPALQVSGATTTVEAAEDRLLRLSEREREHLINPATGQAFTDNDITQGMINALKRKRENAVAVEASLPPHLIGARSDIFIQITDIDTQINALSPEPAPPPPARTTTTFTSIRAVEAAAAKQRDKVQDLADDIDALGSNMGVVTDVMRQELLQEIYQMEGDIELAWNVRQNMEDGLSLGEARVKARSDREAQLSTNGLSSNEAPFDLEAHGATQAQYDTLINVFVTEGLSPTEAALAAEETLTAAATQEQNDVTAYMEDILGVSPEQAAQIVALNRGEIDSIDGLTPEVINAITSVEMRYLGGPIERGGHTPFMIGEPVDIETIADHFEDGEVSAYEIDDGRWATENSFQVEAVHTLSGFPIHGFLDVVGFIPVVGEPADGLNALIYLAEGDTLNAGLSAAALIPVAGSTATGARVLGRAKDMVDGLGAVVKGARKVDGATVNLLEMADGSLVKVVEFDDGTTAILRGSADDLGESLDDIADAAPIRVANDTPSATGGGRVPNEISSDDVLFGTSRRAMRENSLDAISSDPNHPLRFLLTENGDNFIRPPNRQHATLWDNPNVIEMGHVESNKFVQASGGTERVVLQGAWENQTLNVTVEASHLGGGWVSDFPVLDIGGIAVSRETAMAWELHGYLPPGTVDNAARVVWPD